MIESSGRADIGVADVVTAGGTLLRGLLALDPGSQLFGPALPCRCAAADNLALHRALAMAAPGTVLVCEAGGRLDAGYWGELMTRDARRAGVAGLVIDGSVRDTARIVSLGLPVFAAGRNPTSAVKRDPGSCGEPAVVAGVSVGPGDLVVGDGDGVAVVPVPQIPIVLGNARAVIDREHEIRRELDQRRLWQILGLGLMPLQAPSSRRRARRHRAIDGQASGGEARS